MATAGGLVFAGEGNGSFNAYDARTGNVLWQFQTGAGVNAPPITYEIDGQQYIAVASGGNFQLNFPRGDTMWVFTLTGQLPPAPAPTAPASVQPDAALAVNTPTIVDFAFQPSTIMVPPGTEVTWTNEGPTIHTATADDGLFDSDVLQAGDTYSFTFDMPGSYDYFCAVHPFMRAKVLVDVNAPMPGTGTETGMTDSSEPGTETGMTDSSEPEVEP
jgi:plastocyanin